MKMNRIGSKYQKLIMWAVCIAAVIAGGIYYYGILHAFAPNAEELWTTQTWYLILRQGHQYRHANVIWDGLSCLSVLIGGMSYFSIRLTITLCYVIILGLSLYLSIRRNVGRELRWYLLPLWAFFMILIHTVQGDSAFARMYEDSDLIRWYPYSCHTMPLIFCLICLILLQCYMTAAARKRKMIFGCAGIIAVIYACLFTDLIYYIIFVFPVLIVLALRGLYNDKTRKYMMPLLALVVGIMLLTRILPEEIVEKIWGTETIGTSYGAIYGGSDWLNLDNLVLHITNYIKTIMLLFNIDLSDRPLISLYSVLFVVRIAFVVIGYVIVAKIIACSVKGKAGQSGYSMIDEVLAWAFAVLSCAFIFTRNALYRDLMRYYAAFVPLLTVLLCRNIESFMKKFMPVLKSIQYKRFFFAGIVSALCICQTEPVWQYEAEDTYKEDCEAAIEFLRQWEAENDGYAVAPLWLYTRLSAMTNGEILFYDSEKTIKRLYGEDAEVKYMVVGWSDIDDKGLLMYKLDEIAYGSYEEMCEKYKAPVRAVQLDYIYVCEFKD